MSCSSVEWKRDLKGKGVRVRRVLNDEEREEAVMRVAIMEMMVRTKPGRKEGVISS